MINYINTTFADVPFFGSSVKRSWQLIFGSDRDEETSRIGTF